jgi:ferric-dicitrate binding protein FerR (iron transport regulator)
MVRAGARMIACLLAAAWAAPGQVFFAPPEQAAKVVALTGQVSVMRDSVPWALHVGDSVPVRQLIVTGPDGFAKFQLSDGSTFEVYPNSRVTFRNNYGNWKDLLDLWIGRVKVHIEKLGGQPNPNRVLTPTAVISVRGTIFDVAVDEEESSTLVMVEEGAVAVQHALLPRGEPKVLGAGDYIRVYKDVPLAQKSVDKGKVLQQALRSVTDALYTVVYRTPRTPGSPIPGGTTGGGTRLPGDTGAQTPPPPPPPPGDAGSLPPPPPPPGP